jgi:hypothetical protein
VDAATTVARRPGLLAEEVLGEVVILDVEADRYTRLNRSASVVWKRLAEPASVDALADALAGAFGIARERALADASALVDRLAQRDLVVVG